MAADSQINVTVKAQDVGDGLKNLVKDTDALRAAMKGGFTEAEKLNKSIFNLANLSKAIDSVNTTINQLSSAVKDLCDAYAVQEQAETQLETVMRQRMQATDEQIQSIKDLCSAQQALGVIGDEVQLSGAQQIATFLKQKQSLDVLIPAMNNLIAQQKGLNATGSDAVSVANLMGKAMMGQTSALRRVGITFTDAQEQAMKYGDETQRAAMLAQIITDNVGNMNAELAKTDSGRQKQLANNLGDIKEMFGSMLTGVQPFLTLTASLTTSVTGFIKLAQAIKLTVTAVKALNTATKVFLASSGIGIAIAALTYIIYQFCDSADEAADSLGRYSDAQERAKRLTEENEALAASEASARQSAMSQMQLYISKLENFNGTKEEEKKLVKELNGVYGDSMGYFSSVSDWYKALTANSEAYCRQMVLEARTRTLANQIAQKEEARHKIIYDENGDKRKYSIKREKRTVETTAMTDNGVAYPTGKVDIVIPSAHDKATADVKNLTREISALYKQLNEAAAEASKINFSIKGSPETPHEGAGPSSSDKSKAAVWTEEAQSLRQLNDNIAILNAELDDCTDPARQAEINKQIDSFNEQAEAIRNAGRNAEGNTAKFNANASTLEEIEGNVAYFNNQLRKSAEGEATDINRNIKLWQDKAKAIREAGFEAEDNTAKFNPKAKSLKEIEGNVAYYNAQMQNAESHSDYEALDAKRKAWQDMADTIRGAGEEAKTTFGTFKDGYSAVKGIGSGVKSLSSALSENTGLWQRITALVDGFISIHEGIAKIVDVINLMTEATKAHATAKTVEATSTTVSTTATVADTVATEAQITADSIESVVAATKSGAKLPFPANIVAIAAGVAAVVAALSMAGAFASGGIVGGSSTSGDRLVARVNSGEMILNRSQQRRLFDLANGAQFALPRVNAPVGLPEVRIPLERLAAAVSPAQQTSEVEFKIKGEYLVGLCNKVTSKKYRVNG